MNQFKLLLNYEKQNTSFFDFLVPFGVKGFKCFTEYKNTKTRKK